jgi:hypothetical protein
LLKVLLQAAGRQVHLAGVGVLAGDRGEQFVGVLDLALALERGRP